MKRDDECFGGRVYSSSPFIRCTPCLLVDCGFAALYVIVLFVRCLPV